ncbi:cilia- and flagella-associated protein 100 [Ambystoma mexicanum]|uniref:cilia- and flagella-associated protein 100 n=1 Tax=Ambystoma mexicanum TaxID=8296 RepID=UPI0037E70CE7
MSSMSMVRSTASPETSRSGMVSRARTSPRPSATRSVLNSAKSGAETKSVVSARTDDSRRLDPNPFKIPPDSQLFLLRDKEREKKKAERELQKTLKVHEKMTYATKTNAKMAGLRKEIEAESKGDIPPEKTMAVQESPSWKLTITKDNYVEKESIKDYVNKKREMFHLQYALSVKRDEMHKLESLAASEEYKLEKAEQFLEEDAAKFDEFLKENDRNSVQALKIADKETKLKMEKVAEIKRLTAQMVTLKSEILRCEEVLKEYTMYKEFLFRLSPKEWQEEIKRKKQEVRATKKAALEKDKVALEPKVHSPTPKRLYRQPSNLQMQIPDSLKESRTTSMPNVKSPNATKTSISPLVVEEESTDGSVSSDNDEDPPLYFTDSRQLLDIFTELEQQNLSLIQNSQDTEEALEEIKQETAKTQAKMELESQQLKDQIKRLKEAIAREEEKAKEIQIKSQVFFSGQHEVEDQDKMLEALNTKVTQVYHTCIGDSQASLSTLQMLAIIENQLLDLLDNMEKVPPEKMELAEKAKEKERRLRVREEKMKQQRMHQEERLRRALERAQSDPKKTTGRRLMGRSDPPAAKQKEDKDQDKIDKEKEEMLFFFS